jgi:hypothetical protein
MWEGDEAEKMEILILFFYLLGLFWVELWRL